MSKFALIACLCLQTSVLGLRAATITVGPLSYPSSGYQKTNWGVTTPVYLGFAQFDPSLGTLTSVYVNLTGDITGTIKLENEDSDPQTVTGNLSAKLQLQRPGGTDIVVTLPVASQIFNATAYDGDTDFGGTSGNTYAEVTASLSNDATLTAPADLALFTGLGTIDLPLLAKGTSTVSASGNVTSSFATWAAGTAYLQYNYTPTATPEPSTMFLLGSALLGVGIFWRKRVSR